MDRGQYGNSIFVTAVLDDRLTGHGVPEGKLRYRGTARGIATGAIQFETRTFQFYEEYVEMFLLSRSE